MNPCPCGYYPNQNLCSCNEWQIRRYLGGISRALLDRIDVCVEAEPVSYQELQNVQDNETSEQIRGRVERVREIQKMRFAGRPIYFNAQMSGNDIHEFCRLQPDDDCFLQKAFGQMHLSARGCHRVLRVARTIADMEGSVDIHRSHLCEAISYRSLEGKYWGGGLRDGG